MNIYQDLIKNLKEKINLNIEDYLFRISMQTDLERVKKFGSTRVGLSSKLWDRLDNYPKEIFPKYPVLHEDMIIASHWSDIESDALLDNGTLKHKLNIYESPFFTIYKKSKLLEIGKEEAWGENNQGTHFFFLDNPINCLHSLWQIKEIAKEKNKQYYVEEIKWK